MEKEYRVQLDDETRFLVTIHDRYVSLTRETMCMCTSTKVDISDKGRYRDPDGTCWFCRGDIWTTSQDEGTGVGMAELPTVVGLLIQVLDAAGIEHPFRRG